MASGAMNGRRFQRRPFESSSALASVKQWSGRYRARCVGRFVLETIGEQKKKLRRSSNGRRDARQWRVNPVAIYASVLVAFGIRTTSSTPSSGGRSGDFMPAR